MDFPEPVSEARRNCFHPGVWLSNHLRLSDWIGVNFALGTSTSFREDKSPERMGDEVNSVGAGESGASFEEASLSAVGVRDTDSGGL